MAQSAVAYMRRQLAKLAGRSIRSSSTAFGADANMATHSLAQPTLAGPCLSVKGTMRTHPGCIRELNEDALTWLLSEATDGTPQFRMIALIADGMGGHAAGEIASEIAMQTVVRLYNEVKGSPSDVLRECMIAANEAIISHAVANPACAGMGTTCTILALQENLAYLAHIGDSRAYLLRRGSLYQLSEDHSLVAHLVRQGKLTAEEASRSPDRSSILRALGTHRSIDPYIFREGMPLRAGDVLVLCSDGLTDVVEDSAIRDVVARLPPDDASKTLIEMALARGGPDNISIGIFALGSAALPRTEARSTRPLPNTGVG